jgi:hypothetical protein
MGQQVNKDSELNFKKVGVAKASFKRALINYFY